ncbi:SmtA SAM-dependent methyltransferases [Candidatus Methylopumilus planktonicus]
MIFNYLKRLYANEMFNPRVFGLFTNPFYISRRALFKKIQFLSQYIYGDVLDIGCGKKPYISLFSHARTYVGLELNTNESKIYSKADFFYDGSVFPFPDNSFDCIVCNQVFEHVFNPSIFILEIRRVLKPHGQILITVPFVWDEHSQPYDFARYTSFGLSSILKENNFKIRFQFKTCPDISAFFQLLNSYIMKITENYLSFFRKFIILFIVSVSNIIGYILGFLLPDNPDFYLDQVILATNQKLT